MDRVNGADHVDIGGGRRGFRDEDLGTGVVGTEVPADWLNSLQEEILKVIEMADLDLDQADWTQLYQALQILGLSRSAVGGRWTAVLSIAVTAPPVAPAAGDVYLVPAGATGAWATHVGALAEWTGAAWRYTTPQNGHGLGLPDGTAYIRVGGSYRTLSATLAEVSAGTVTNRFVTPSTLRSRVLPSVKTVFAARPIPNNVWTRFTGGVDSSNTFGAGEWNGQLLTVPKAGDYIFNFACYIASTSNNLSPANITGGLSRDGGTNIEWFARAYRPADGNGFSTTGGGIMSLAAGEQVGLYINHSNGGTPNISAEFSIFSTT